MESTPEMTPDPKSESTADEAVTPAPAPDTTPEPPAPEPPVVEAPAADSPIASTVSVPADPSASDSEGGEWHLLMEKLNGWCCTISK